MHYDLQVQPDYASKTIVGKNKITYKVTKDSYPAFMQIDLQEPLIIDSIVFSDSRALQFEKSESVWLAKVPKQPKGAENNVTIYYHGTPKEAVNPPWDGGWIWTKDSVGRPWMTVACQGTGASVWYPCKDHQSDEPDNGASLTIIVPDTLVAVGNGRLVNKVTANGLTSYTWAVVNPINNYNIIPYIGKYENFSETFNGEKGKLDVNYWVLDYDMAKAKSHMEPDVQRMLKCFEHWFGPYPFYEDGYKIVDAPHLGMEHQSAVAYGNAYGNGYRTRDSSHVDLSGSGWGLKWDYIIVHESGHEWFANNITSNDIADMWVHEGFTDYSETLFTEYYYGKEAANDYNFGQRKGIQNKKTIIGTYGVNEEGSGDMYPKGANLLHTIRHSINNDEKFRQILRGLNKTFYHQTVDTKQVENYVSKQSGFDYSKVFDQYLRTTQIPTFEFYFNADSTKLNYHYTNCINGFNLPLNIGNKNAVRIVPTTKWQTLQLTKQQATGITPAAIERLYYLHVQKVNGQ